MGLHVFVHAGGVTRRADAVDPGWLCPNSGAVVWVSLVAPTTGEARVLSDPFGFHELAVEDALSEIHHPKIEAYAGYLYLILHGIDIHASGRRFTTHDTDFFLGPNYLVTVDNGRARTLAAMRDICGRNPQVLAEGAVALLHRIIDMMVDHYRPEVDKLEGQLDALEKKVFERPQAGVVKSILELKRDIVSLRRVTLPQRDLVGRLARREFDLIGEQMAYRFRDVQDQLVRLADEAAHFQDRLTGVLEAHLSTTSNRLSEIMKVLTVMSTILLPLTVLTGAFGMNVLLPRFPGGEKMQFWWVAGLAAAMTSGMLLFFRRRGWI